MRFLLMRATLAAAVLLCFPASSAHAGVTFTVIGTSGADPNNMNTGETITVDIRISSDGDPAIFGLGAALYGYEPNVISFTDGDAVASYLHDTCLPAPTNVCFNGLDNVEGGALTAEADGRIQIGNSASLTGRTGTGDLDPGLDGAVGGDDAQFRLTFEATARGTTTLTIGTGANQGDVITLAGGATEQAINDTLTIHVDGGSADYYQQVLADTPVAYWTMDDLSSPILDEIGNRLGYLLAGSITTGEPSAIQDVSGTSIGSGPSGATILSPYDAAMNTSTFSVESWVRFGSNCTAGTGGGGFCSVIRSAQDGINDGYGIGAMDTLPAMTLAFVLNADGQVPSHYLLEGPSVLQDQWYYLVGSFDGAMQRFFVNGIEYASQPASFIPNSFAPFELFGSDLEVMENGGIDEVAYYDYALDPGRILAHYVTGLGAFCDFVGALPPSTASLGARQNNYCEDWSGVSQPGSDLNGSILAMAKLAAADLIGADLSNVVLERADLSSALLAAASLVNADLNQAILSGAFLLGTDMSNASMVDADLTNSRYDENTLFPSGNPYDLPPWNLSGDVAPWDAGMIPVPEPSVGMMLLIGAVGLAGLSMLKGGA